MYEWYLVDPIITLLIAGYILFHAGREIPGAVHILMQGVPTDLDVDEVTAHLKRMAGVVDVHHVHLWHIDEHRRSLEAHIVIQRADISRMEAIKSILKEELARNFRIDRKSTRLNSSH